MKGIELWHNRQKPFSWLKHVDIETTNLLSNQVVVQSVKSLVSSGTERLVMTSPIDEVTAMKMALPMMKGSFNHDFTYGYSLVGKVIAGKTSLKGRYVHLLHPHQSFAIVKEQDLFFISDENLVDKAPLLSNLETVINAIWDAQISVGDRVLVIGYGIIGALLCHVIQRIPGVKLTVLEKNEQRKGWASKSFNTQNPQDNFDLVFNTSCSEQGLQSGIDLLAKEGTLIELSWYGAKHVNLNLGNSFHYDRKKIISSQVSDIPSHKMKRWNYSSRKELALQLLKEIDFSELLTKEISFEETPSFYNSLRKNEINEIGIIINY